MDDTVNTERKPLGWWWFLLQFATVGVAFALSSLPLLFVFDIRNGTLEPPGMLLSVILQAVAGCLVAAAWLARDGALPQAWNLRSFLGWKQTALIGLAATAAIVAWFILGAALLKAVGLPQADVSLLMNDITSGPAMLAIWIVLVAWLSAGLGEELLFRGFLMDRLLRLRGIRGRYWLANLLQASLFGLSHGYQSVGGVILTGVIGYFLGWLRTRVGGSLVPLILAHAGVDTVMMLLGYAQKMGWIAAS